MVIGRGRRPLHLRMTGRQRLLLRGHLRIPERRTGAHGRMTRGKIRVHPWTTHAMALGVCPADYHPVPVLSLERIVHHDAVVNVRGPLRTEGHRGIGHVLIESNFRYRDIEALDVQADLLEMGLEVTLYMLLRLDVRPASCEKAEQEG